MAAMGLGSGARWRSRLRSPALALQGSSQLHPANHVPWLPPLASRSLFTPHKQWELLTTGVLLMAAPFGFMYLAPLFNAVLYSLVLVGVPLTKAAMPGARLLIEQSTLYTCLLRMVASRHGPRFFGKGSAWVRMRLRGPWLWSVLGGYAASLAMFNLVEPINQALLPHLAFAAEGPR